MLLKEDFYRADVWPRWARDVENSPHNRIFLHGIMGSELFDHRANDTLWVDLGLWHEVDNIAFDALTPDGGVDTQNQLIYARSTVNIPALGDHYDDFLSFVGRGRFNYDWRDSLAIEAQRLAEFFRYLKAKLGGAFKLRLATHSMGGCVLLRLLATTQEFDADIENIVFIAPPFWGALAPLRVIEEGTGAPADFLISNVALRQSAATLPGLFNLLVAPPGMWQRQVPGGPELEHPIRSPRNLYSPDGWRNRCRFELRDDLLRFTRSHYLLIRNAVWKVTSRLADRIHVIVGLNGKTPYAAQTDAEGNWRLHTHPDPPGGKLSNGDGTVLFQSSILPGLPTDRYWAYVPPVREETHSGLPNEPAVISAVDRALSGKPVAPAGLVPFAQFAPLIDWSHEQLGAPRPKLNQNLNYLERARARAITPTTQWGKNLNPQGRDAELFARTREAALKVLAGADLNAEAARIGTSHRFLREHVGALVAPVLFG